MAVILRVSLFLLGVLYIVIGFGFLTDPTGSGADFGLALADETSTQGLSSLRADFTSFFWVTAGCLILGSWKANATLLNTGAALMGIVFLVRGASLYFDGVYQDWMAPMAVELLTAILALTAARVLPNSG